MSSSTETQQVFLNFNQAKLVTVLGIVLQLVGCAIHSVICLIGLLVWLIGVYALSKHYGRREIFSNALYVVLVELVGIIIAFIIAGAIVLGGIIMAPATGFTSLVVSIILAWIVLWITIVIAAVYMRRHINALAAVSPSENLERAGKLIYIGALLTIIIVGALVMLVGLIFLIIGVLDLKPPQKPGEQGASVA